MLTLSEFLYESWLQHAQDTIRRTKTSIVKTVVPKPARDVLAGAALTGKAINAAGRGHTAVANRMKRKARQWAMGNRKEPDPHGQWNGNNSYHRPVT